MVEIHILYEGDLHCRVIHGPSGTLLSTDAPKDNQGKGESFSPTDLLAAALGSCIITTMGIVAKRHALDLKGAKVTVVKEMTVTGERKIRKLEVTATLPDSLKAEERVLLERTALTCPVHKGLSPDIEVPVYFLYQ